MVQTNFFGWAWETCIRLNVANSPATYAVFISDGRVVDARAANPTDNCEGGNYAPLEIKNERNSQVSRAPRRDSPKRTLIDAIVSCFFHPILPTERRRGHFVSELQLSTFWTAARNRANAQKYKRIRGHSYGSGECICAVKVATKCGHGCSRNFSTIRKFHSGDGANR